MTSALLGATSVEQLEQNVAALEHLEFSADELDEIDRYAVEGGINLWKPSSSRLIGGPTASATTCPLSLTYDCWGALLIWTANLPPGSAPAAGPRLRLAVEAGGDLPGDRVACRASTAVTSQSKVAVCPGFSGPSAHVFE